MLKIILTKDEQNNYISFEAEGHTGISEKGTDVACAGASAIIQTAVLGLTQVLQIKAGLQQEEGHLYFTLPFDIDDGKMEKAQILLRTMLLGLEEVKKAFPEAAEIEVKIIE